ncbi:major histocompatibility complex class I-related gene protein-like isoform X2 [Pyxicephalus adspersus]|uniref:major histocompatibility complex class I-related gene protein-like isoform X2 n=1 Tax=Pyxicephalus adspersus TaxID=30357 RepID=UPI003B5B2AC4
MDLLLSILLQFMAWAEPHSLRYHFTTDSSPGTGYPYYQAVGYVDDVQIARYDSETQNVQLLWPWMKTHIVPQHWENQTQIAQYYEGRHQQIIHDLIKHLNPTKDGNTGFVLQVRLWCLLSGDDSISGYEEFAANGNDFIALDTFFSKYVPVMSNAEMMADVWNRRKSSVEKQKWYIEEECNQWFKIYLHYMKENLKPVRPEMMVRSHVQSDGVTRLHCLVYSFHPRAVDVKWMMNGVDHIPSDEMSPILPHPDGTYQIRVSIQVPTGEKNYFSCHAEHSSLEEPLKMNVTELDLEGMYIQM